jgi:hypothetical protein
MVFMLCCRPNYFGLITLITISIAIDFRRRFIVSTTAIETIFGSKNQQISLEFNVHFMKK